MPTNPTKQIDPVVEARELLDSIDKSARVGYAFKLLRTLADEVEALRALTVHMHVHSAYRDNGYLQMTTPQKALYDAVWERSVKELDEKETNDAHNPDAVKEQQVKAIASEIKSLRSWLDYLERDIANDKGVIHVLLLISISESCTKLIYGAGVYNGAALSRE